MASYEQLPAELNVALVPGDELNIGLNFTQPSGSSTVPLNLTGYTIEAKAFVPSYANPDGGFGSGSYTVGATAATFTVSPVSLSGGQVSLGLTELQTATLSPATGYRWYLRWTSPQGATLTVMSGTLTARLP